MTILSTKQEDILTGRIELAGEVIEYCHINLITDAKELMAYLKERRRDARQAIDDSYDAQKAKRTPASAAEADCEFAPRVGGHHA